MSTELFKETEELYSISSPIPNKQLFNSKLFLDVNINEEIDESDENSENNTEGSDNSCELEEINYLSNELIEQLDSIDTVNEKDNKINDIKENVNIVDSLLSLVNSGYEFKPKSYKPPSTETKHSNILLYNNNINNNSNHNIAYQNVIHTKNYNHNYNSYINNKNYYYRDQKKDWVCSFCNNLNFSFRTKCNRCKTSKEKTEKFFSDYNSINN